jgi:hypothetical protein
MLLVEFWGGLVDIQKGREGGVRLEDGILILEGDAEQSWEGFVVVLELTNTRLLMD